MRQLLLFAFLLLSVTATGQKKQITLEDLWKDGTFRIKSVPGFNAMKDGKRYTQIDEQNGRKLINVYNLESGKKGKTIYDNALQYKGKTVAIDEYLFSDDEKQLLLLGESQNIYRRSILHKVYV
jgi:dipeptidyl-peptidase-4